MPMNGRERVLAATSLPSMVTRQGGCPEAPILRNLISGGRIYPKRAGDCKSNLKVSDLSILVGFTAARSKSSRKGGLTRNSLTPFEDSLRARSDLMKRKPPSGI